MEKEKIKLKEEDSKEIFQEWKRRAEEVKYPQMVKDFLDHLINDYRHDYGTMIHAMRYGMKAAFRALNEEYGITGFQASCLMWMMIEEFGTFEKDATLRILTSSPS